MKETTLSTYYNDTTNGLNTRRRWHYPRLKKIKIEPLILISQGLPPVESVTAMFAGDWSQYGWMDNQSLQQLIVDEDEDSDEPWTS